MSDGGTDSESRRPRIIAGAMSGTSADGVDVALVRITGRGLAMSAELLHHHHCPYDEPLRRQIFGSRQEGAVKLADLARLGRAISLAYAVAVKAALAKASITTEEIAAVAAHGQTLFHDPPNTIQWLDPALLAAEVGCAVVSDFRRADCAAGGQGAPLVPFADYVLFRHPTKTRVLLNIGGIANITHLPAGCAIDRVLAFDTGPGNCVCDFLMRQYSPSGNGYDKNGEIAAGGIAVEPLVQAALRDLYFAAPPPKSTDGPAMILACQLAYEEAGRTRGPGRNYPFPNLMRTACQITALTVAGAVAGLIPPAEEVIASGGGTQNPVLMALIREAVAPAIVLTTEDVGVPAAAKESVAFALLGAATLDSFPSNVPTATGATRGAILGSITPRQ